MNENTMTCPKCGGMMVEENGMMKCEDCGHTMKIDTGDMGEDTDMM